jgi:hypothetical protein
VLEDSTASGKNLTCNRFLNSQRSCSLTVDQRKVERDEANSILLRLVGQEAWGANVGFGTLLHVEFGEPMPLGLRGHIRGEWHLSSDFTAWRLDGPAGMISGSEDGRETMSGAIQGLNGRQLESAALIGLSPEATFKFEGGFELRLFPVFSSEHEHWTLFMPDHMVVVAGPGNEIVIQPADTPLSSGRQ